MKKLIFILMVGSLFIGCSEEEPPVVVLGSCVLSCSGCGNGGYSIKKCYEGVYTKKECMDKQVTDGSREYSYSSYSDTETCSEYCDSYAGTQYGYCTEY